MNQSRSYVIFWVALAAGCILTCLVGAIPWGPVWEGALQRLDGTALQWNPLLDERLPRLIVILCTGASLAVSGAVMQSLFQNPLASPSVLGISCGGSLLVLPVFILGLQTAYPFLVPLTAFCGCLLTLLLVYALARRQGRSHISDLFLTGIAISTFFVSVQATILYALRDNWQLIQLITEWDAGSTSDLNWKHVHMQLPLTIIGLWGCWTYRREMNILTLGEEEAANLGVDVPKVRWRLFLSVALLTGGAIAAVGIILFYGLVLPHIIRKLYGCDNSRLIPLCTFGGGLALLYLDLFLRILDIHTLTVGNISALLGGLFFLSLLLGTRKQLA